MEGGGGAVGCCHCGSSMAQTAEMMPRGADAVAPDLAHLASKLANAEEIELKPVLYAKAARACSREPYCALVRGRHESRALCLRATDTSSHECQAHLDAKWARVAATKRVPTPDMAEARLGWCC